MYYTFKSNKIYPVIKAGKNIFKKVDHFAPVSPMEYLNLLHLYDLEISLAGTNVPVHCHIDKDSYSIPFPT